MFFVVVCLFSVVVVGVFVFCFCLFVCFLLVATEIRQRFKRRLIVTHNTKHVQIFGANPFFQAKD